MVSLIWEGTVRKTHLIIIMFYCSKCLIDQFTIAECSDFPKMRLVSLQPRGKSEMASCIIIILVTMAYSGTSLHEDNFVDSFAAQYPYCQCNLQCVSPCLWFEADWVRG